MTQSEITLNPKDLKIMVYSPYNVSARNGFDPASVCIIHMPTGIEASHTASTNHAAKEGALLLLKTKLWGEGVADIEERRELWEDLARTVANAPGMDWENYKLTPEETKTALQRSKTKLEEAPNV